MMEAEFNHVNHATCECKYHIVFTPKYRKKLLFGKIKRHLGQVFCDLRRRKECLIEEGHLMPDHVHVISIQPNIFGGTDHRIHEREEFDMDRAKCRTQDAELSGPQLQGVRHFVTTVSRDKEVIRAYIGSQELADRQSSKHTLIPALADLNQTSSFAGGYGL
jgi:putative transposase